MIIRFKGTRGILLGAAMAVALSPVAEAASSRADRGSGAAATRSQGSAPSTSSAPARSSSTSSAPRATRGGSATSQGSRSSTRGGSATSDRRVAVPRGPETTPRTRHLRPGAAPPPRGGVFHPHIPYWHYGFHGGWGWGWSPWLWTLGWYSSPAYGVVYRQPAEVAEMGPVRVRVSPRNAEVWVDGERVGVAAELSGWPDYLWLPEGTYDLALYSPGYRTIAQQITVSRETPVRISYRMERGESTHPQDLVDPSTERREMRLQRDYERQEAVGRAMPRREDWRQRSAAPVPSYREPAAPRAPAPVPPPVEVRSEPLDEVEVREERLPERPAAFGSLELSVTPEDASVYLDDRFLGTAGEISAAAAGVLVEPGERILQVVRPGFRPEQVTFTAAAGEGLTIRVELERYP